MAILSQALIGCAHSPPAASAQELSQVRDEVRKLRAEREEDRRAIRVLEARLAANAQTQVQTVTQAQDRPQRSIAPVAIDGSGPVSPLVPKDLAVVRLAPQSAPLAEDEGSDEDSYVFIADAGSKKPTAPSFARRTGGPDAAPALPLDVALAPPQSAPLLLLEQAAEEGGDEDYRSGADALEAGDPARAIELLEGFVKTSPRHRSADNAVLALGEAWLALDRPGNALQAFERVVREYPAGDVVPDALLRYGETCMKLGRTVAAQAAFQRLVEDHPTSAAAGRAQVHLATR